MRCVCRPEAKEYGGVKKPVARRACVRTVTRERLTEGQKCDNVYSIESMEHRKRGWKGESVIESSKTGIERRGVSAKHRNKRGS